MPKPLKFRARLYRYPPILIRLLVTRGRWPHTSMPDDRELAAACELTMAEFKWVSYSTSWDGLPDRVKYAYLGGCKIDLENRRCFRRLEYMRRSGQFRHLRRDPNWPQWSEMLDLWAESTQNTDA